MRASFLRATSRGGRHRSVVRLDRAVRGVDEVWIETPVEQPESADPFLLLLAPIAAELGETIHLDGPVSASLLLHADEFVRALHTMAPCRPDPPRPTPDHRAHPAFTATEVHHDQGAHTGSALAAATGGIDSTYTLLRHTRLLPPALRLEIPSLVFVHGYDVPLDDDLGYLGARDHVTAIGKLIGADVLEVTTNYRTLVPDWEIAHGAAVAAALHACRDDRYGTGLIAASAPYDRLVVPWGSAPFLDHLFSTRALAIFHDGADANRADKVAALGDWPEVIEHLKFCWAGPDPATNCGQCPKCVFTGIFFDLCGVPLPPFTTPPTDELRRQVVASLPLGPFNRLHLEWAVHLAEETGCTASWYVAGRDRLTPVGPDTAVPPLSWWRRWAGRT